MVIFAFKGLYSIVKYLSGRVVAGTMSTGHRRSSKAILGPIVVEDCLGNKYYHFYEKKLDPIYPDRYSHEPSEWCKKTWHPRKKTGGDGYSVKCCRNGCLKCPYQYMEMK